MTAPEVQPNSHDQVSYKSHPDPRTHPDHFATMATLFGMFPAPVEQCRVLELGCAAGGNLIPMAEALPGASFVGIDLSKKQLDDGRNAIAALGLGNIRLKQRSILDIDADFGTFDYIVCHGVYSWVSDETQQKILTICRENLSKQGVAYISYNTLPGWHLRASVREMMNFHAGHFTDVATRIEQARALLDFLVRAAPAKESAYGRLLHDELEILRHREDSYLFHEHLEEHNQPVYFHRFMERASEAGLRFLGEAQLGDMIQLNLPSEIQETLADIAPDIIHMEQYRDFLNNRMFRRTLLCQREVELERDIGIHTLRPFQVLTPLVPKDGAEITNDDAGMHFKHPRGGTISVAQPLHKVVLTYLGRLWPGSVPVTEIPSRVSGELDLPIEEPDAEEIVGNLILDCVVSELMELRLAPSRHALQPNESPKASPVARFQAAVDTAVTNRRHETVYLDDLNRRILQLLDGSRDRAALVDALCQLAETSGLNLMRNDKALKDPLEIREALQEAVESALPELARNALLIN